MQHISKYIYLDFLSRAQVYFLSHSRQNDSMSLFSTTNDYCMAKTYGRAFSYYPSRSVTLQRAHS